MVSSNKSMHCRKPYIEALSRNVKKKNNKRIGSGKILSLLSQNQQKATKQKMKISLPIQYFIVILLNLVKINPILTILELGIFPTKWSSGIIIPIYKKKGERTDPEDYRPITFLNCVSKLFTSVLNDRLQHFILPNNLLSENQAGFRAGHSITDHQFTLNSIIELFKFYDKRLFCCYIDFSKAFDSVWRVGLWSKLLKYDINGIFSSY